MNMGYDPANNRWNGISFTYNLIGPDWMHPDEHDTARAWTAPRSRTVRITGTAVNSLSGGDGVNVKIMKNGTQVWPASGFQYVQGGDATGVSHDITTGIQEGEALYFVINRNGNSDFDTTTWNSTIAYEF